ncbi:g9964 [Coccomyxa elongata]
MLATAIGLGIGAVGGISVGNILFAGKLPEKDLSNFSLEADNDETIPMPPAAKDGNVQGKPRSFLPYAPAWAKHPDYDRVLWMNTVLRTMWPYYNHAIGQQTLEQVNPIIAEQLKPYPFIQAVDIEVLDLGTKPPAIGGAKTYTSSVDEAILEAPVMWGSDMRVRVAVRIKLGGYVLYLPVEVSNVQVRADARITFAPLVETLPCLGAVTISLLDPPHLDVSLCLIGGLDLLILPGIREAVHFALQKVLGDLIVYPNRMTFDIMPGGGKPPEPIGMLVVKVKNVSDIHGGGDLFSKVDPFVQLSVRDGRKLSTETVWNNKNPEYNEVMNFIVDDPKTQSLTAFLKDHDFPFHKTLGVAEIPLVDADFMVNPRKIVQFDTAFFKPEAHGHLLKLSKVGAGASAATKQTTANQMGGPEGADAKDTEESDESDAKKATKDLDRLAKKDPSRFKKAEVGYLHLEVQFCPFKSSGEAAESDPVKTKKPGERTMMRRMTRSNITSEHKGVLTVNVISATNLTTPNEHGDVDPFVEVALYDPARNETERQETSKLVNEPDPKFGEKFDFIMASATSILNITVYDTLGWMEGRLSLKGLTGRKETKQKIGNLRLNISEVVRNGKLRDSWALQDTQQGDITMALTWTSIQLDAESDIKAEPSDDKDADDNEE